MTVVPPPASAASGSSLPYWRLSGYYFFYFSFIGVFSPYFGQFLKSTGFSAWEIALLLGEMQVVRVLAPNLWGWWVDHGASRLGVIRLASVLALLTLASFWFLQTGLAWALAIGIMGFFWSAALPLFESLTFDHLGTACAQYSRIRLWGSIGFVVTVLLAGRWFDARPMTDIHFWLAGMLLGVLLCALLVRDVPQRKRAPAAGSLRGVLRQRHVQALLVGCFAMSAAHGALYFFYSIFLAEHGYSQTAIGVFWSIGVLAEIAMFMGMARLLHRYSVRLILLVCLGAAVLRFAGIALGVGSVLVLVLAQLLHALTFGAHHAAAIHAVNAWFPADCQGRGQALYSSLSFGAGGLLGGVLAGAVWQTGGGVAAFLASAAFAGIGGLVLERGTRALPVSGQMPGRTGELA